MIPLLSLAWVLGLASSFELRVMGGASGGPKLDALNCGNDSAGALLRPFRDKGPKLLLRRIPLASLRPFLPSCAQRLWLTAGEAPAALRPPPGRAFAAFFAVDSQEERRCLLGTLAGLRRFVGRNGTGGPLFLLVFEPRVARQLDRYEHSPPAALSADHIASPDWLRSRTPSGRWQPPELFGKGRSLRIVFLDKSIEDFPAGSCTLLLRSGGAVRSWFHIRGPQQISALVFLILMMVLLVVCAYICACTKKGEGMLNESSQRPVRLLANIATTVYTYDIADEEKEDVKAVMV